MSLIDELFTQVYSAVRRYYLGTVIHPYLDLFSSKSSLILSNDKLMLHSIETQALVLLE